MTLLPRRRAEEPSRGQALIEFALVLPIILLLLVLAVDFGRVFFGWVGIQNAARIGANFAASHPEAWSMPDNAVKTALRQDYLDQIQRDAEAINCTLGSIDDPAFTNLGGTADPTEMGDQASVTLECDFTVITPIASGIVGNPVSISSEAIFTIRGGTVAGIPTPIPTPPPTPTPSPTPSPSGSATPSPSASAGSPSPTPACGPPTASFSVATSPTNGKSPVTATLGNSSSAPAACAITGYQWDFGNGNVSAAVNPPSQVYTHAGAGQSTSYTIVLTVTSPTGTDSHSDTVSVKKP